MAESVGSRSHPSPVDDISTTVWSQYTMVRFYFRFPFPKSCQGRGRLAAPLMSIVAAKLPLRLGDAHFDAQELVHEVIDRHALLPRVGFDLPLAPLRYDKIHPVVIRRTILIFVFCRLFHAVIVSNRGILYKIHCNNLRKISYVSFGKSSILISYGRYYNNK